MKLLLTFLLIIMVPAVAPTVAYAQDGPPLPREQADIAVRLFQKACLKNYGRPEKTTEFLEKYFNRAQNEHAIGLLETVKVDKGTAWFSMYPQGTYSVVQGAQGNCYVIAEKSGDRNIHEMTKVLARTVAKDLSQYVLDYSAVKKQRTYNQSGFDVRGRDDVIKFSVTASTPVAAAVSGPAAIIAMIKK